MGAAARRLAHDLREGKSDTDEALEGFGLVGGKPRLGGNQPQVLPGHAACERDWSSVESAVLHTSRSDEDW